MTRKQLVHGLRALHETDIIKEIRTVKKTGHVIINFTPIRKLSGPPIPYEGQLIITNPL